MIYRVLILRFVNNKQLWIKNNVKSNPSYLRPQKSQNPRPVQFPFSCQLQLDLNMGFTGESAPAKNERPDHESNDEDDDDCDGSGALEGQEHNWGLFSDWCEFLVGFWCANQRKISDFTFTDFWKKKWLATVCLPDRAVEVSRRYLISRTFSLNV